MAACLAAAALPPAALAAPAPGAPAPAAAGPGDLPPPSARPSPFASDEARLRSEQAQVQALLNELVRYDLELARLQAELEANARALAAARRRLASARERAARLDALRRATAARTGSWLRWLRESGAPGLLDVFLGTASLRDLFWRVDILTRLAAYEIGLLRQASRLAEEAQAARRAAEAEARRVASAESALEARQRRLQALRQERARALAGARLRLAGASAELEARERSWLSAQGQLLAFWRALGERSWAGARPSSTGLSLDPPRLRLGFDAATLQSLVGGGAGVGFAPPDLLLDFGPLRLRVAVRALPGEGGAPDRLELLPSGLLLDGQPLDAAVLAAWSPGPARLQLPDVAPGLGLAGAEVEPDQLLLLYAPRPGG
ncbi:MAG: hypothetical protein QJR08_09310 [Bacillota bacterium]|nr:hypothetical protein [Bacillota bacterium]